MIDQVVESRLGLDGVKQRRMMDQLKRRERTADGDDGFEQIVIGGCWDRSKRVGSEEFEIGEEHAVRTKGGIGDQCEVMTVLVAPELCRRQAHEGCPLGGSGFGHAGHETGALVCPDDAEVRSIPSNPRASMIGDGKRLWLI